MIRLALVFTTLLAATFVAWPTTAQEEPPDVTFEGAVDESISNDPPATFGNGTIRITLTPNLDGVLRAEVAGLEATVILDQVGLIEHAAASGHRHFWPPIPVENGSFTLRVPVLPDIGEVREYFEIAGEVVSGTELRGTIDPSYSLTTTWNATGPAETPPGQADLRYDVHLRSAAELSVWFTQDRTGVTAFDLRDMPIDACVIGEEVTVRAFFDPPVALDSAAAVAEGLNIWQNRINLDVRNVTETRASGTLLWRSGPHRSDCSFEVAWQTDPFPTVEPTSTANPTGTAPATSVPEPTPTVGPNVLPSAGSGGGNYVTPWIWAIGLATAGAALAFAGAKARRNS